ncbi:MAG: hypothetical protein R3327_03725 [Nitrosopumilaceae archaeon]|nr:hypothetical protein [Nitrosopumilaceae archaeon]
MSDIRLILIGVGLVFAGFLVLGVFGDEYRTANIQSSEFGECYEYFDDAPPKQVDCNAEVQNSTLFFGVVLALIGAGIVMLVKGYKGKWDNEVRPEEMLGPGGNNENDSEDKEEK